LPVHIVQVNVLLAITPAHDVIDRSRIFDSELARHARNFAENGAPRQSKSVKLWFDPFTLDFPTALGHGRYSVKADRD
jgi:hypothetical protein